MVHEIMFPDELHLKDSGMKGDSRIFTLDNDFRCFSLFGLITVPKGFATDGASIPELFWNILNPFGPYFKSSIIHDWGYSPLNNKFTKKQIDLIFLEGMKFLGVGFFKRYSIYNAVRILGYFCYKGFKG